MILYTWSNTEIGQRLEYSTRPEYSTITCVYIVLGYDPSSLSNASFVHLSIPPVFKFLEFNL